MAPEPARPEPVLRNGRGHNSERPAYHKKQTNKQKLIEISVMFCKFLDEEIKRKTFRDLLKDLAESGIRNQGTIQKLPASYMIP